MRFHIRNGSVQTRLGIQRVEYGFEQKDIDTALDKRGNLLGVSIVELAISNSAESRITNVRTHRRSFIRRPKRARDEYRSLRMRGHEAVGLFAGEAGGGKVHLADESLRPVVLLRDSRGVECVCGEDISAGLEILSVDVADNVRARDAE